MEYQPLLAPQAAGPAQISAGAYTEQNNAAAVPLYPNLIAPPENFVPSAPEVDYVQPEVPLFDNVQFDHTHARQALEAWAQKHFFKVKGLAAQLEIPDIISSNAYYSLLETFIELRKIESAHRPYDGGHVDGPHHGPAPGPWDIPARPSRLFQDQKVSVTLPHTEEVRGCFECLGTGVVRCGNCSGEGHLRCHHCNGHGHRDVTKIVDGRSVTEKEHCQHCHHGRIQCNRCNGSGSVTCPVCQGHRELVHYSRLDIIWQNRTREHAYEASGVPDSVPMHKIRDAHGPLVWFEDEWRLQVRPARVNDAVADAINRMIESAYDPNVLQHRQRVSVRGVPTYTCRYRYKGELRTFWVIGLNREVHAPGYPISVLRVLLVVLIVVLVLAAIGGGIGALSARN